MSDDCIFCKIAAKEIPSEIVYEDDEILAFKDINARAPVHLLVIPKRHIETFNDLNDDDMRIMADILSRIRDLAVSQGVAERGYRIVVNCNRDGGQEVFHLHFHLMGGRGFSWPPG